jgi:hypothetical protein
MAGDEGVHRRLLEDMSRSRGRWRAPVRASGRRRRQGCSARDSIGDPSQAPHLGHEPKLAPRVNVIARENHRRVAAAGREGNPHALSDAEADRNAPPRQRDIVRSISFGGQSIAAMTGRLKMTEIALQVALHRALESRGAAWRSSIS